MKFGAIILAAGLSSRMDGFKPLLRLGKYSLLEHCARLFRQSGIDHILVVSGHRAEEVATEARQLGLTLVHNPRHAEGMFSSVQAGVQALGCGWDGFFLLPVDIPLVRPATLPRLLGAFAAAPKQVIIPCFAWERGHPPLIPTALIPDILAHDGSDGLQGLLAERRCLDVAVWDRGVLHDADTPDHLATMAARLPRLAIPDPAEGEELTRLLVPPEVQDHARQVARAAVLLGQALNQHGRALDLELLLAGGLLHDLAKGQSDHGRRAAELLTGLGLAPVAATVAEHVDLPPPADDVLHERHLVCLADKALRGSRLIEPRERYQLRLLQFSHNPLALPMIRRRMKHGLALQRLCEAACGRPLLELLREGGL